MALALLCSAGTAYAQDTADEPASRSSYTPEAVAEDDRIDPLPPEARGIEINEKIGDTLPLDLELRTSEDKKITLREIFDGNLPVIVTFNYSSCPMLCSLQLNALFQSIKEIPYAVGTQYRIVTIGLDPNETPDASQTTKGKYLEGFPKTQRRAAAAGWYFLTGEESVIRALADAAGIRYRYLEKTKEYVHPASLVFVSPNGIITQYYHGIHYEPDKLGKSIFDAGAGEMGVSMGFLLACFQLGDHGEYAKMSESIMRYGAIGFVILLLLAFGTWQVARSRKARQE